MPHNNKKADIQYRSIKCFCWSLFLLLIILFATGAFYLVSIFGNYDLWYKIVWGIFSIAIVVTCVIDIFALANVNMKRVYICTVIITTMLCINLLDYIFFSDINFYGIIFRVIIPVLVFPAIFDIKRDL
jgi:hypothetical protein